MNVIFDMDGLMFDTEKVFIKAWDYAGERIGIGKAGYMVYKTLGMSIVASYEIWNEEFGDRYNQEELRKYTKEFLKNYYEIIDTINRIHNFECLSQISSSTLPSNSICKPDKCKSIYCICFL